MKKRLGKILPPVLALALGLVLLVGCDAGTGEQEQPGGEGEEQRPQSLRLETVEQWAQSGHARVITFAAEEEGCKNCHDGLTFTETGGGFQPRMQEATGTTGAQDQTDTAGQDGTGTAQAEQEQPRDWVVAQDCRTCHTGAGVQIAEEGSIEGVPSLDTAEGGRGALCMACHNGWHPAGEGREGNAAAPHYSVQTDMLFGVNTLQVGGTGTGTSEGTGTGETTGGAGAGTGEAAGSPHLKVKDTCVGCHVAGDDDPNHLFRIENFDGCEGENCHDQDMTDGGEAKEDYDGDGSTETFKAEVEGLMQQLEDAVNKAAGSSEFRSEAGNVVFEGGGQIQTSDPAYQGAYNWLFIDKDKSGGVHNGPYTIQVLQDSIAALQ